MKTRVVYDSLYGNTKAIAEAIGQGIAGNVKVLNVKDVKISELESLDLLIVGSPTHAGRPSKATKTFLNSLPDNVLKNIPVTAFDTGISSEGQGFFMRVVINFFGYAAKHILNNLKEKGGTVVSKPKGFIVKGKEGPLKEGEFNRATQWAKEISQKLN